MPPPVTMLETLPDEILMVIVRYSGGIYDVVHAFSGLNQRLSHILIDRRLRLLTDFIGMDATDPAIESYYRSPLFQTVSEQLLSLNSTDKHQELSQCLQSVVTFHIQNTYEQYDRQLEENILEHQMRRVMLSDSETTRIDGELQRILRESEGCADPKKVFKRMESLVRVEGARLSFPSNDHDEFNFARAVNHFLLENVTKEQPVHTRAIRTLVRTFKALLVSNPELIQNQAYAVNGGCTLYYFLFYLIYRTQHFNCYGRATSFNVEYYRAAVDLLLFFLVHLRYDQTESDWATNRFLELLSNIDTVPMSPEETIYVQACQREIFKVVVDGYLFREIVIWDIDLCNEWQTVLGKLIPQQRWDMFALMFEHNDHVRELFQRSWNTRKILNAISKDRTTRRMFETVLKKTAVGIWLAIDTDLILILLQNRERHLLKAVFEHIPSLIHRLDEDGNDPLLYTCLKVRGCRHRLIEYLISIGCDTARTNCFDIDFHQALQQKKNHKLREQLLDHEIIQE